MTSNEKTAALAKIGTINAVEGFDPTPLAVEYTDMNTRETRLRLPVMSQIAWFRLKYPEGRFTISTAAAKDCFVATARVYKNYMDPVDCFLSEASTSRGYMPEKPTISPREWAQTAALGIALRNAGFGLQFHAAGESFDEAVVNELGQLITPEPIPDPDENPDAPAPAAIKPEGDAGSASEGKPEPARSDEDPLESAMKMKCPIGKYSDKTLGDMIKIDPKALVWVVNKFSENSAIGAAAKLICDHAMASA